MSEMISSEEFARLVERAGLTKMASERLDELRQGYRYIERMQRTVRRPRDGLPRDRAAEPAHIFVHPND
jgi:hypothetical protein